MKKIILLTLIIALVLSTLTLGKFITGNVTLEQKVKLGYCPTMQEEAFFLSEENNYELVSFSSASEVLFALRNNQIDKAIIGRKAKLIEINPNTKETILEPGYTLVSIKKGFISYSELPSVEVYTSLSSEVVSSLIPQSSRIIYIEENEIHNIIKDGKIALISWEDWNDDFELIVVMKGNEKVKDFRGVFLYEN